MGRCARKDEDWARVGVQAAKAATWHLACLFHAACSGIHTDRKQSLMGSLQPACITPASECQISTLHMQGLTYMTA